MSLPDSTPSSRRPSAQPPAMDPKHAGCSEEDAGAGGDEYVVVQQQAASSSTDDDDYVAVGSTEPAALSSSGGARPPIERGESDGYLVVDPNQAPREGSIDAGAGGVEGHMQEMADWVDQRPVGKGQQQRQQQHAALGNVADRMRRTSTDPTFSSMLASSDLERALQSVEEGMEELGLEMQGSSASMEGSLGHLLSPATDSHGGGGGGSSSSKVNVPDATEGDASDDADDTGNAAVPEPNVDVHDVSAHDMDALAQWVAGEAGASATTERQDPDDRRTSEEDMALLADWLVRKRGMQPDLVPQVKRMSSTDQLRSWLEQRGMATDFPDEPEKAGEEGGDTASTAQQQEASAQLSGAQQNTPAAASAAPSEPSSQAATEYFVKRIHWGNATRPIILQNTNGPCPLLALCNVLLLRERIHLHPDVGMVTFEHLIQLLSECLFESRPQAASPEVIAAYESTVQSCIEMFPKLQRGLDVNVRFSGVDAFEFTQELSVFDAFNIALYHGWVPDPQEVEVCCALAGAGYNQTVELLALYNGGPPDQGADPIQTHKALVVGEWMDHNPSQLTYHGVTELHRVLKRGELCVLFRNNHFHVLLKHNDALYLLVTDQGYMQTTVAWETLSNVDGDSTFLDGKFQRATAAQVYIPPDTQGQGSSQSESDRQLALSLWQQEQRAAQQQQQPHPASAQQAPRQPRPQQQAAAAPGSQIDADHEFAMRLWQEEQQAQQQQAQQQRTGTGRPQQTHHQQQQQQQQQQSQQRRGPPTSASQFSLGDTSHLTDEQLARALQEQENAAYRRENPDLVQGRHPQQQSPGGGNNNGRRESSGSTGKKDSCSVM